MSGRGLISSAERAIVMVTYIAKVEILGGAGHSGFKFNFWSTFKFYSFGAPFGEIRHCGGGPGFIWIF